MQKFCFKLNKSEERFRQNIDSSMIYDQPETFLFSKRYGKGLSFTQNGDIIKGVYLQCSDKDDDFRHGSSIRTRFYGKIIHKDDGVYFSGWIYPDLIPLLIMIAAFFAFLSESEGIPQMIIPTVATAVFLICDITLSNKCFKELSFMASGE